MINGGLRVVLVGAETGCQDCVALPASQSDQATFQSV
jgi:disulfide oxidoreductase YuzD